MKSTSTPYIDDYSHLRQHRSGNAFSTSEYGVNQYLLTHLTAEYRSNTRIARCTNKQIYLKKQSNRNSCSMEHCNIHRPLPLSRDLHLGPI